jgi:LmbE family N-acetylglucosaminyl deacetylase
VNSAKILHLLKKLSFARTVLYLAAHPDDENTALLAWFANHDYAHTAYLSLTRGEGGQNLLGTELDSYLGALRTAEVLKAREIDGAEQFFSGAFDFGYSKGPEDTFRRWNKEKVLSDIVWVIRNYQPDIIVTRFPTTGEGGHGHHTVSALLAEEAFYAAADAKRFPEQLKSTAVWQAARLVWNDFRPLRDPSFIPPNALKLSISGMNPLLGKWYGELAAEARSMHKTQGFGVPAKRGMRTEYFIHQAGKEAKNAIWEDVPGTLERVKGGKIAASLINEALEKFNAQNPQNILPLLYKIKNSIPAIEEILWRKRLDESLNQIIAAVCAVRCEIRASSETLYPDSLLDSILQINHACAGPLTLHKITISGVTPIEVNQRIPALATFEKILSVKLPQSLPYSTPAWFNKLGADNHYDLEQSLRVQPGDMCLKAKALFSADNCFFETLSPIIYHRSDPVDGERNTPVRVVPKIEIIPEKPLYVTPNSSSAEISVELKSDLQISGTLKAAANKGWLISPEKYNLAKAGVFTFAAKAEKNTDQNCDLVFSLSSENKEYSARSTTIYYPHLFPLTVVEESKCRLLNLSVKTFARKIGYIEGAGDQLPQAIKDLGYEIGGINSPLSQFDSIVIGVRALNVNPAMYLQIPELLKYMESGGVVISQYNVNNPLSEIDTSNFGPYPFRIDRDRVTDENAKMTFLDKNHPIFNEPNSITEADFAGWVHERGLYFAKDWDPKYTALLLCSDPGEPEQRGALLVAKYGKGAFIYCALSLFRQIPAGVAGAYRLLTNLISYRP